MLIGKECHLKNHTSKAWTGLVKHLIVLRIQRFQNTMFKSFCYQYTIRIN